MSERKVEKNLNDLRYRIRKSAWVPRVLLLFLVLALPANAHLNENADVWLKEAQVVGANFTFQSPSGDWAHFVMYYFRPDGSLAKVEAQLNTFYGNMSVVRERWYSSAGKLLKATSRQLDLRAEKSTEPDRDFVNKRIPFYRRVEDLPFYALLETAQSNKTRKRPARPK